MNASLYIKIYNDLKEKITAGVYQIGDMIPPEKELTELYDVSRITIRRAVTMLAEDGIVERKSGVGTFVIKDCQAERPNKFIGLILSGLTDSYGKHLLQSIIATADARGYELILKLTEEDSEKESGLVDEMIALGVSGLLIEPVQRNFYNTTLIKHIYAGFPIVIIDKELQGIDSLFVGSDHYKGAQDSAQMLIDNGHKNPVIIGYSEVRNSTLEKRIDAFTKTYWQSNMPFAAQNIARVATSTYLSTDIDTLQKDVCLIKKTLQKFKPSCVVSLDAHLTGLVQQALWELDLRYPDDISLFGFDSANSSFIRTNYTHLSQDEETIGSKSVEVLDKAIRKVPIKNHRLLIPATLKDFGSISILNYTF
ncbi:GntR family transcriptional regulator [Enterococcus diestrammenae]|uniref:HTH gntR-type domain-containing protein n=1 Tax=Enterococcus diestrammenae TaxID=1155073 RepID=A0ABV0EYG8_9ENTE|nr:GntR family transcriptional regulator [Enterococcus diestrammenae]KAF1297406.1 hypothetical protein BAU18_12385 [Enterococcus diestrammenae]